MGIVAFDTETFRFRAGLMAPPIVCVQWATAPDAANILHVEEARPIVEGWLDGRDIICGHNTSYDMACIAATWRDLVPKIFAKYDRNEVTDTQIRQQLLDIKEGVYRGFANREGVWTQHKYNLSDLHKRHCGRQLEKDIWRLRYAEFRDLPIAKWPRGAIEYALEDARATYRVFRLQRNVDDEFRQARYAFALHLSSAWGIKTDPQAGKWLKEATEERRRFLEPVLKDAGLLTPGGYAKQKNVRSFVAQIAADDIDSAQLGFNFSGQTRTKTALKLTEKGQIAIDSDTLEEYEHPLLNAYAEWSTLTSVTNKDVPLLEAASVYPAHTRYTIADSGRARSGGPNIQNIRRLPGIREAFVPRPGNCFIQADYEGLELRTWAQCCLDWLGFSKMAEVLNSGMDPHLMVASQILKLPYDVCKEHKKRPDVERARQTGKVVNFSAPGGMENPETLKLHAWCNYKCKLTVDEAAELLYTWRETWPEAEEYKRYVLAREGRIVIPRSLRARYAEKRNSALNSGFQGLGSDVAKLGLYLVSRAMYSQPESPLFGFRSNAFVHDEIIGEGPIARSWGAAQEMSRLMIQAADRLLPGVRSSAPPMRMMYWSKEAVDMGSEMIWGAHSKLP